MYGVEVLANGKKKTFLIKFECLINYFCFRDKRKLKSCSNMKV